MVAYFKRPFSIHVQEIYFTLNTQPHANTILITILKNVINIFKQRFNIFSSAISLNEMVCAIHHPHRLCYTIINLITKRTQLSCQLSIRSINVSVIETITKQRNKLFKIFTRTKRSTNSTLHVQHLSSTTSHRVISRLQSTSIRNQSVFHFKKFLTLLSHLQNITRIHFRFINLTF